MAKLILIGGPPAVGKSTLRGKLDYAFDNAAFLDADDVWRVRPFKVNEQNPISNVITILKSYLEAKYPLVFLTWVLANPHLSGRILKELNGLYESHLILHLVASEQALADRFEKRDFTTEEKEYSLGKLREIYSLGTPKIDTTDLSPDSVVEQIRMKVSEFAT